MPVQAKYLQHSQGQAAGGIWFQVNANKTKFPIFKQEGAISTLSGRPLKLEDKFSYLGSNISSTDVNIAGEVTFFNGPLHTDAPV